jgi:hypothetical protein
MKRFLLSAVVVLGLGCGAAEAGGSYHGHYRSAYSRGYQPSAYINGGYFTPWGYQPYSMTITPTYGGAIYQGNGGLMGWGAYSPYSFGRFVPSYGWGYGFGGGY